MLSRNILFQQTMQYSRGCLDVFSRVFSFFVSRLQLNAYFCKNYSCRKPDTGKSKGGIHIHKRRNCTLWFWRCKNFATSQLLVKNKATGTPCGVHIHRALNISNDCMLWESVRVCWLYTSSWGFRRCSFRLTGAMRRPLHREASDRLAPRFFVYVRILNFTKPFTVVVTTTLLDLENE